MALHDVESNDDEAENLWGQAPEANAAGAKILPLQPRALGRVCPRNTDAAISEKMATRTDGEFEKSLASKVSSVPARSFVWKFS